VSVSIAEILIFLGARLVESHEPKVMELLEKLVRKLRQLEGFEGNSLALVVTTENANENTSSHNGPVHVVGEGTSIYIEKNENSPHVFGNVHGFFYGNGSNSYSCQTKILLIVLGSYYILFQINGNEIKILAVKNSIGDTFIGTGSIAIFRLTLPDSLDSKYNLDFSGVDAYKYGGIKISYYMEGNLFKFALSKRYENCLTCVINMTNENILEELCVNY
jgi:hypothetical protein